MDTAERTLLQWMMGDGVFNSVRNIRAGAYKTTCKTHTREMFLDSLLNLGAVIWDYKNCCQTKKEFLFVCFLFVLLLLFLVIFLISAGACFHGQPLQFCICINFFFFFFGLIKLFNTLKRSLEALPAQNTEHFN